MAKLQKKIFGMPKGKLGDLVFKTWRDIPYISTCPRKYNIQQTEEHLNAINNFLFCVGFCSSLNKISVFKDLWETPERPAYMVMLKNNLTKLRRGSSFAGLSVVPDESSVSCSVISYQIVNEGLQLLIQPPPDLTTVRDKWISVQGVLCLKNSSDENKKSFYFIPVFSGDYNAVPNEPVTFDIKFTSPDFINFEDYSSKELLVNLISKDMNGSVNNYSDNIYLEL